MVTTKNVEQTFEFKECMYIQTAGAPVHLVNMYLVLCHIYMAHTCQVVTGLQSNLAVILLVPDSKA